MQQTEYLSAWQSGGSGLLMTGHGTLGGSGCEKRPGTLLSTGGATADCAAGLQISLSVSAERSCRAAGDSTFAMKQKRPRMRSCRCRGPGECGLGDERGKKSGMRRAFGARADAARMRFNSWFSNQFVHFGFGTWPYYRYNHTRHAGCVLALMPTQSWPTTVYCRSQAQDSKVGDFGLGPALFARVRLSIEITSMSK